MIREFQIPTIAPGTMVACLHAAMLPCGCGIWVGKDLADPEFKTATVTTVCSDGHDSFGKYLFDSLMLAVDNEDLHDQDAIDVAEMILGFATYGFTRRN